MGQRKARPGLTTHHTIFVTLAAVTVAVLISVAVPASVPYPAPPNVPTVKVVVTSFRVHFVYTGIVEGYYHLITQGYLCSRLTNAQTTIEKAGVSVVGNQSETYNCDTYDGPSNQAVGHAFLDSIIFNSTTAYAVHTISNVSVSTLGFKLVYSDAKFPLDAGWGEFTVGVGYAGTSNFTGPVDIMVYSPS